MQISPVTAQTIMAGVIGKPVAHSLSPMLHNTWLAARQIDGVYIPLEVGENDMEEAMKWLVKVGFRGCNITIPHKERALQLVDEVEEVAESIGAVNTIVVQNKKLLGFNTDAYGFWENIKPKIKDKEATLSHAVVLGAGGAARAVVYALKKAGAKQIHIIARDPQKAESLAEVSEDITISECSDLNLHLSSASLLINTTPLGMKGKEASSWDLVRLSKDALVTDIVYNPIQTQLLRDASTRGNAVVDGLGMLIHQALPGFEAWFGQRPELQNIDELKQELITRGGLG